MRKRERLRYADPDCRECAGSGRLWTADASQYPCRCVEAAQEWERLQPIFEAERARGIRPLCCGGLWECICGQYRWMIDGKETVDPDWEPDPRHKELSPDQAARFQQLMAQPSIWSQSFDTRSFRRPPTP